MTNPKTILAVLSDLMFAVKIQDAAKRLGLGVVLAKTEDEAIARAKQNPSLVIVDLNIAGLNSIELIKKLKASESTRDFSVVGFVSHVQTDLLKQAQVAGCDEVVARSVFSQNLPAILSRSVNN
jgi:CheY-like chemotaxis protein